MEINKNTVTFDNGIFSEASNCTIIMGRIVEVIEEGAIYPNRKQIVTSYIRNVIDFGTWQNSFHIAVYDYRRDKKVRVKINETIDKMIVERQKEIEHLNFCKKLIKRNIK